MSKQTAPAAPRDNLFGICHALGETFGFNPLYLRIVLLIGVIVNPEVALGAYFAAGITVTVAKLATRSRSKRPTQANTLARA